MSSNWYRWLPQLTPLHLLWSFWSRSRWLQWSTGSHMHHPTCYVSRAISLALDPTSWARSLPVEQASCVANYSTRPHSFLCTLLTPNAARWLAKRPVEGNSPSLSLSNFESQPYSTKCSFILICVNISIPVIVIWILKVLIFLLVCISLLNLYTIFT